MLASLFGRCIGLSAVVCVLLLFFFPLPHGNFQSTHGPVTDLRSRRTFLMLAFSILRACFRLFATLSSKLKTSFGQLLRNWGSRAEIPEFKCSLAVLRC